MGEPTGSPDLNASTGSFVFRDLPEGARVRLKDGAVAQVTGNPRDGAWLLIRFLEHPTAPGRVGEEDMVFFTDVESIVQ